MTRPDWAAASAVAALFVGVAAMACANLPAQAQSQPQTRPLTFAVAADVTSLDPHFHNTAINHATGDHIYEPLTFQDAQMLTRVGIETRLDTMVNAMFIPKINAREHPMFMMSYLSSTSITVLRSVWVSKGSGPGNGVANRMDYRNAELDHVFLAPSPAWTMPSAPG